MPALNTSSRGRYNKKKGKSIDQYKEACPPHKVKDLDELVKRLGGDEEKISLAIQEWWEEPQEEVPQWEEINKKKSKSAMKAQQQQVGGRGRGGGRGSSYQGGRKEGGGGRGGFRDSRGGGGGRGSGGRKVARGGGGGHRSPPTNGSKGPVTPKTGDVITTSTDPSLVPDTSSSADASPKCVWGNGQSTLNQQDGQVADKPSATIQVAVTAAGAVPSPIEKEPLLSQNDPALPGQSSKAHVVSKLVTASGNLWVTKGGSYLIKEAEKAAKPKPPKPVVKKQPTPQQDQQQQSIDVASSVLDEDKHEDRLEQIEQQKTTLDDEPKLEGLSASVIGANVNAAGWEMQQPLTEPSPNVEPIDMSPPVADLPITEPEQATANTPPSPEKVVPAAPTNVLNMGHWGETGETDAGEEENLNFGFGSFGTADNEIASVDNATTLSSGIDEASAAKDKASRPPPGLSINGGMPPMPANAVLVHELENKLESASLKEKQQGNEANITPSMEPTATSQKPTMATTQQADTGAHPGTASILPPPQNLSSPNYNTAYGGGMGVYNYQTANSGFVGMQTPAGPVIAGGLVQHQQKPQQVDQPAGVPQHLQQQQHQPQSGLYSAQMPAAPVSTSTASTSNVADSNNHNNATLNTATGSTAAPQPAIPPPGMPGAAMPYSPFYLQQPYQMGQPHDGSIGYGYGYGAPQFGGAVQGGYGYQQQVMGQPGGAYGQPNDDHSSQQHHGASHNNHHSSGGHQGGYQKNSHGGGYRGRNTHHNNNSQYQSHYNNLQHGGYGQPPYGMGYSTDHFQQRGGYGLDNMDPYGNNRGNYGQSGNQNQRK